MGCNDRDSGEPQLLQRNTLHALFAAAPKPRPISLFVWTTAQILSSCRDAQLSEMIRKWMQGASAKSTLLLCNPACDRSSLLIKLIN